ncbi:PE-PGRS family protein, partial [Mycobacterium tuberculosis]
NAGKSGGAPGPSGAGGAGGLLLGENGLNGLM